MKLDRLNRKGVDPQIPHYKLDHPNRFKQPQKSFGLEDVTQGYYLKLVAKEIALEPSLCWAISFLL